MKKKQSKKNARIVRHQRLRQKIVGSAERPRLCVYRSLRNIYAQLIDDGCGHTLLGVSSLSPEIQASIPNGGTVDAAKEVGKLVAQKALEQNISTVVFDRGGFQFHGRVAALANSAREEGLQF